MQRFKTKNEKFLSCNIKVLENAVGKYSSLSFANLHCSVI